MAFPRRVVAIIGSGGMGLASARRLALSSARTTLFLSRDTILDRPELKELAEKNDPDMAYSLSKAANYLRVQAAAKAWAEKGARINSVSPGAILTAMLRQELESPHGETIKQIIAGTPLQRGGTADEIASVVAFLAGSEASYVTGTDILVDGGTIASHLGPGRLA
ncbi:hypothetical protein B0T21DRAFT_406962 [Apiosordaria backusii]|uniref:Uncharacterized protein n=1 Tax=Apiosordaria backusii TaxID=314023 RepID=A0AA40EZL2_9PEZI|nr:hypothetical protein B0T21DRAFT_406962 [Apiosordaria backusii]